MLYCFRSNYKKKKNWIVVFPSHTQHRISAMNVNNKTACFSVSIFGVLNALPTFVFLSIDNQLASIPSTPSENVCNSWSVAWSLLCYKMRSIVIIWVLLLLLFKQQQWCIPKRAMSILKISFKNFSEIVLYWRLLKRNKLWSEWNIIAINSWIGVTIPIIFGLVCWIDACSKLIVKLTA